MQPRETFKNSFDLLKVFLELLPPLSLDSVFLVANASSVLFIICQVFAHVMVSCATLAFMFNYLGTLVDIDTPPFVAVFTVSNPMILCI